MRRADHLAVAGRPARPTPSAPWWRAGPAAGRTGPIRLLTHPRYAGYVFNPLSLFYCFDATGERIDAVVADVTNTPVGRASPVRPPGGGGATPATRIARHAKALHVSPFLPMALDYDWRIGRPGASLAVRIAARTPGVPDTAAPVFTATLALRRRPIDGRTLAGVLVRFPAQTAQVVAGIYWQALRPVVARRAVPRASAIARHAGRRRDEGRADAHDAQRSVGGVARRGSGRAAARPAHRRPTATGARRSAATAAPIWRRRSRWPPPAAYRRLVLGGSLGGAEAYLRGEWTADDLPAVLRILAANLDAADRFDSILARLLNLPSTLTHRLRRNTRRGSRRNIRDHYDLGNDLFALFLDETMTYSCGVFEREDASLHEASVAKLDLVCRKLALDADHRVLEIGGGWGSFALHAARHYGCHVTTTTVSRAQFEVATARVAAAGLGDRISCCSTTTATCAARSTGWCRSR